MRKPCNSGKYRALRYGVMYVMLYLFFFPLTAGVQAD